MALAEDGLQESERPFSPPPVYVRGNHRGRRDPNGKWAKPTKMPKGHVHAPPEIRERFGDAKVCTRTVAAFILGVSRSEFCRRERMGIYPSVVDKRGRHWFDEENLRRIAGDTAASRERRKQEPPLAPKESDVNPPHPPPNYKPLKNVQRNGYDAETAAKVFRSLMAGKTLEETIVELEVHPDQALLIYESWTKVKGWIVLKDEHLANMAHLPLRGGWPPKTAEQFVLMIRGTMECGLSKCAKCKASYARLCASCAAEEKAKAPPPLAPTPSEAASEAAGNETPP